MFRLPSSLPLLAVALGVVFWLGPLAGCGAGPGAPAVAPAPAPAPAPDPAPDPAPSAPACAAGQEVVVDLDGWQADLRRAGEDPVAVSAVLARLGLAALEPRECGSEPLRLSLEGIDVFPAALSGPEPLDRVVQARLVTCADDYQTAQDHLRIAVLRPVAAGRWCLLGDLSLDQEQADEPCLGEPAKLPRTFAFVHLTDAARQTLRVKDQGGRCDGVWRGARFETSYWDVQGDRLVEVFRQETYWTEYDSPRPPTMERSATIRPKGAYPKELHVTRSVLCSPPDEEDDAAAAADDPPCVPATERAVFEYLGGRYVER